MVRYWVLKWSESINWCFFYICITFRSPSFVPNDVTCSTWTIISTMVNDCCGVYPYKNVTLYRCLRGIYVPKTVTIFKTCDVSIFISFIRVFNLRFKPLASKISRISWLDTSKGMSFIVILSFFDLQRCPCLASLSELFDETVRAASDFFALYLM